MRLSISGVLSLAFLLAPLLRAESPASTTLASSTNPSVFGKPITLTATVTNPAASPPMPTGTVAFYSGVLLLGKATLVSGQAAIKTVLPTGNWPLRAVYAGDSTYAGDTSAVLSQTVNAAAAGKFTYPVFFTAGSDPYAVAVGDFNGDGKADVAAAVPGDTAVDILLGNGDGTFKTAVPYGTGPAPQALIVADFNGDGNPDLAVMDYFGGISILLGKGDGTFNTAVSYGTAGSSPTGAAAGDFNADGNYDLAVTDSNGIVSVLLGNGDGTFKTATGYPAAGTLTSIAIGDFNGDGIADLAVTDSAGGNVDILPGLGNGTFGKALIYSAGKGANGVVVSDLNGDGKADLALGDKADNAVVLLGNGDGTFQPAAAYGASTNPGQLQLSVEDFNGDGIPDIVAADDVGIYAFVLLGFGDGTFLPPVGYSAGYSSLSVVAGDFNGDGIPDLVLANGGGSNVSIVFGVATSENQTITFSAPPNVILGALPFNLGATASSGLAVYFFSTTKNICTVSGVTVTALAGGLCSITAVQPGNATYNAAPHVTQTFTVFAVLGQTITFGLLSDQTLGSSLPPLSATASSGLGVVYTSNTPLVCTVSGVNITLAAVGICSITAVQNGSLNYTAATPVTQTFTVSAAGIQPVAAFLDQNNSPALTFNESMNFPDAGGFLIGAPGVTQDLKGNVYVVGLDGAGGVHLNSYGFANSTWNGWQYSGGILDTSSGLTAAVDPSGVVWFTGRDIGNRYWINSWNGTSFGGWILVADGIFAGDSIPQIAIPSDGTIYVIGKDIGGRIWSNSYNPANQTFTGWVDRQAVMIGQPSVTAGQDGMVYVAVRSTSTNSPVYITQIPAQNGPAANTWLNGGGLIDTDPQITSQGGTVYLLAEAANNTVYLLTFSEATQMYGAWTFTGGILNSATIAAAAGNVFVSGLDGADRIYWYSAMGNSWFFAGGAGISSTSLAGGK